MESANQVAVKVNNSKHMTKISSEFVRVGTRVALYIKYTVMPKQYFIILRARKVVRRELT